MSVLNASIKNTFKPESRIIYFGNPATDPEIAESMRKQKALGREVHAINRPGFDTGLGKCGKHLCHCKVHCGLRFDEATNPPSPEERVGVRRVLELAKQDPLI